MNHLLKQFPKVIDREGLTVKFQCNDPPKFFTALQKDNKEAWDTVIEIYTPKLADDAFEYARQLNERHKLGYSNADLREIVEIFTDETWPVFRQKVTNFDVEFQGAEGVYNYRLTIIINLCRRELKQPSLLRKKKKEKEFVFVPLDHEEVIRIPTHESRHIEGELIIRELLREIILDIHDYVSNPTHVDIYLERKIFGISSKELGEKYGYSPKYIDNLISKINKRVEAFQSRDD